MSKILYPIFNLPNEHDAENEAIPTWIKWWLLNNYKKSHSWILSEIITGNPITLENSVETKFYLPPLPRGNSEQDGTPSPTNEVPIQNVTGDVEVLVQNKKVNLYDGNMEQGTLAAGVKQDNTTRIRTTNFMPIENLNYYFNAVAVNEENLQCAFHFYTSSYSPITEMSTAWQDIPYNFTVSNSNAKYCKAVVKYSDNATIEPDDVKQVLFAEQGHKEQTLPLTLGNIELCKIGTAQDYFYKENNKWYLYKAIGKVVVDGSSDENWYGYRGQAAQYSYRTFAVNGLITADIHADIISDHFIKSMSAVLDANNNGIYIYSNNVLYIAIDKSLIADTEPSSFKTWLASNNVIAYYQSSAPTTTEITDTTLIEQLNAISNAISYEEQTNISGSSSEAEPIFEIQYYMKNESEGE